LAKKGLALDSTSAIVGFKQPMNPPHANQGKEKHGKFDRPSVPSSSMEPPLKKNKDALQMIKPKKFNTTEETR
jgi:hypothetical protein